MWPLFIVWTALASTTMAFEFGPAQTGELIMNTSLREAFDHLLRAFDAIWILLAGTVTYLAMASAEGLPTARRWAAIILLGSAALSGIGAATGFPFGPLAYTDVMGLRLGRLVPFTLPFLWLSLVIGSRYAAMRLFPCATIWQIAACAALLVAATDIILEPIAWKVRAWWLWYPRDLSPSSAPPLQNHLTWLVAGFALAIALGENRLRVVRRPGGDRAIGVFLLLNAALLSTHAVRWLRG